MLNENAIVEAIHDLTRVTIALSGKFASKSDAVRQMSDLSIPASRISAILAIPLNDVTSIISKHKKKKGKENEQQE